MTKALSADMGAYGEITINKSSNIALLLDFKAESSFTQIIKVETEVLKEYLSISSPAFFMVLCSDFSSSLVGSALETSSSPCPLWNNLHNLPKNFLTPSIPLVFQGLNCSRAPRTSHKALKYRHHIFQ